MLPVLPLTYYTILFSYYMSSSFRLLSLHLSLSLYLTLSFTLSFLLSLPLPTSLSIYLTVPSYLSTSPTLYLSLNRGAATPVVPSQASGLFGPAPRDDRAAGETHRPGNSHER